MKRRAIRGLVHRHAILPVGIACRLVSVHESSRTKRDEKGAVLVIVAAAMAMLMGAAALSVDVGREVVDNRTLQAVADAVAMDAVELLNGSPAASVYPTVVQEADAAAARNGFTPASAGGPAGNELSVTLGLWNQSGSGSSAFTALSDTDPTDVPSAVQVQVSSDLGYVFQTGSQTLARTATAGTIPEAGFTLGTYLASFDSTQVAVLNSLLSTLGASVSLTAAGYQGLAAASVTFDDLLAADSSLGSLGNLLSASFPDKTLLDDLGTALGNEASALESDSQPTQAAALEAAQSSVDSLAGGTSTRDSIDLCDLVDVGSSCAPSGADAGSASVDVLSVVTGLAEVAAGTKGFQLSLGVGSALTVSASVVHPAVTQPPGPVGTQVETDQADASVEMSLGLGSTLTITAAGAQADAALSSVDCAASPQTTGYSVQTNGAGLVATATTALGSYSADDTITGGSGSLTFDAPWTPADGQSVSTASPGLSFTFQSAPASVSTLVAPVLSELDPELPDILTALGIGVAGATVVSSPTYCQAPTLVQ